MPHSTLAQPDRLLRWMSSLADATRLRLLALLVDQELGVSDLCDVLQLPQSTVSRHLKILASEGWAISRRRGTTNMYQVVLDELDQPQRELWLITREQASEWATWQQDRLRLQQVLLSKQQDPDAFFADAAEHWEAIRHELYGRSFSQQAMLGLLPSHWTVADLGCGNGALARELAPFVQRIIGVDQSDAMLAAGRSQSQGIDNIELRQGELSALPIDDASVDATLCVIVLSYVADPAEAIAEMSRVLRPGGRVVIVDLLAHDRDPFRRQMGQIHRGFGADQLSDWFAQAGLHQPTCRPLPPSPEATGPALIHATAIKPPA